MVNQVMFMTILVIAMLRDIQYVSQDIYPKILPKVVLPETPVALEVTIIQLS
jgi:hypothetical protein